MEEKVRSEELLLLLQLNVVDMQSDKQKVRSRLEQKPGILNIVSEIMDQAREVTKTESSSETLESTNLEEEDSHLYSMIQVNGQELSEEAKKTILQLIAAYKLELNALRLVEQKTITKASTLFQGHLVNLKTEELNEKLQIIRNIFTDLKDSLRDQLMSTVKIMQEKRKRNISKESKDILQKWYKEHQENPYASSEEKKLLAEETGLTIQQVSVWISNKRNRSKNKEKLEVK